MASVDREVRPKKLNLVQETAKNFDICLIE